MTSRGTIVEKVLAPKLVSGGLERGREIGITVDQVLLPDSGGTLVWLQFEAMGLDEVQIDLAAQYCDHLTYQFDFRNSDDHRFLRSAAGKYGAYFSKPGNGICHTVHREQFAAPGKILLGADSHTPTAGGLGQLAIGAGGVDVAVAMGGAPYYIEMPEIVNVRLEGELPPWATAKDVILELLRRLTVKGAVGKILEYTGPGVETLTTPERMTITNMGTELGATTSIFPADEQTRDYLERVGRTEDYVELQPDDDAEYVDEINVDLSELEPMIAKPSMPDNVVPVSEVAGKDVDQVVIGSCTNGGYEDILPVAKMLEGRKVDPTTEVIIAPGSKQTSELLAREGWLAELMAAGATVSEATCGACMGIGHVPASDSVSLRTFNRNFEGRSGNEADRVHLCSPEVATASAIAGEIADPRGLADDLGGLESPGYRLADAYGGSTTGLILPDEAVDSEIVKGPNIDDVPIRDGISDEITGEILLKMDHDVTTDHIIPASQHILMYRSNVSKLSEFTLSRIDESFADRAADAGGGVLVAGRNYGQGSSREHAALCPMYLSVDAIFARSFARIHRANLVNFGILPLTISGETYSALERGDEIKIVESIPKELRTGTETFTARSGGLEFDAILDASEREREILVAGGKLPWAVENAERR